MTFKYKHKKTQTSKTQRKEEKRTRFGRELPSFSPPSRRPCLDGALVVPPHCLIWKPPHNCNATTKTKTHQEPVKKNKKKKKKQKNHKKWAEIWAKPKSEKPEKRVEIWATQIETNRLRTISKNPARNAERGWNSHSKHKPEMQTKPKTQPEIHPGTQTQTPKPIPKHKHNPKSILKQKHKRRNLYRNRNTSAKMG